MTTDRPRQLATIAAYVMTVAVNAAANALPINRPTAEISDQFHVYVIPAGYVFAIWGLIYVGLGAYTIYQAVRGDDPVVRRLGWLPALSGVFNTVWLLLFQFEVFVLTVPVMLGLLATLIVIYRRTWDARSQLTATTRWVIRAPFSIYLGWITIATIANVAQTLSALGFDGFGLRPELIASAVLVLGLAIAARIVWQYGDIAYGLVIVWAYIGIVVKESGAAIVPVIAGAGAVAIVALVIRVLVGPQRPRPVASHA